MTVPSDCVLTLQLIDLRRIVAARERSLESLRSTLNTTKQFLEERLSDATDRLSQANDSLAEKEAEVWLFILPPKLRKLFEI